MPDTAPPSPRTVKLGTKTVKFPSQELCQLDDETALWEARDFEALKRKFQEQGWLYLKGVVPRGDVAAGRRRVLEHLMDKTELLDTTEDPAGAQGQVAAGKGLKDVPFLEGRNQVTHSEAVLGVLESAHLRELFGGLLERPSSEPPAAGPAGSSRSPEAEEGGEAAEPPGPPSKKTRRSGSIHTYDFKWLRIMAPDAFTGVHADWVYMGRGTPRVVTCWIPFGDIPVEMGTLAVLKGSATLKGFRRLQETYGQMDTERDNLDGTGWFTEDPDEVETLDGGAQWATTDVAMGDIILFGMQTLHMSTANLTGAVRISADTRWQAGDEAIDPRYSGDFDVADRKKAGAWASDNAAAPGAASKVTISQLKEKWGFDPKFNSKST